VGAVITALAGTGQGDKPSVLINRTSATHGPRCLPPGADGHFIKLPPGLAARAEAELLARLEGHDDAPREIKEGMVFALETYCPATDGRSAARIEEEVVVGANGLEILTKFPAQELYVTNPY
jgi:hypothetical protein